MIHFSSVPISSALKSGNVKLSCACESINDVQSGLTIAWWGNYYCGREGHQDLRKGQEKVN